MHPSQPRSNPPKRSLKKSPGPGQSLFWPTAQRFGLLLGKHSLKPPGVVLHSPKTPRRPGKKKKMFRRGESVGFECSSGEATTKQAQKHHPWSKSTPNGDWKRCRQHSPTCFHPNHPAHSRMLGSTSAENKEPDSRVAWVDGVGVLWERKPSATTLIAQCQQPMNRLHLLQALLVCPTDCQLVREELAACTSFKALVRFGHLW